MTVLERLKTTPTPDTLYHYTTQAGLLGVLEAHCFWATAARYLNDSSEYLYGLKMISERLMQKSHESHIVSDHADRLRAIAQALSPFWSICVVSLTSEGDLLSQWRAYAGGSGGFALGLRAAYLRDAAHAEGFYLVPCLYDKGKQQEAIDEMAEEFCDRMRASPKWDMADHGGCVATAMRIAMMLKDESFKEEQEWRLISRPIAVNRLNFRQGTSAIIPFFKLPLSADRDLYVDIVRVGPTPHADLAVASAQMLLRKLGLSDPENKVVMSRVPFRNW